MTEPREEFQIEFIGTIRVVDHLGERRLTAFVVGFNPLFVATIAVESVESPSAPFEPGSEQHFAIHSPTYCFFEDWRTLPGKRFALVLKGERQGERRRYLSLERRFGS